MHKAEPIHSGDKEEMKYYLDDLEVEKITWREYEHPPKPIFLIKDFLRAEPVEWIRGLKEIRGTILTYTILDKMEWEKAELVSENQVVHHIHILSAPRTWTIDTPMIYEYVAASVTDNGKE